MRISLIAAVDEQEGIGHHGKLPWRLSTDLKRFKALTMGHHLVMGRKTWESIGRALDGRTLIIVTRQENYQVPAGCWVVHSLQDALELAEKRGEQEVFVIGGGELYREAMDLIDRMYLTRVNTTQPADTFFPPYSPGDWLEVYTESIAAGEKDDYATTYSVLERRTTEN